MQYNFKCLDEQMTRGALLSKAAYSHNLNIVGKVPLMCGLTSPAVRLGNGSAHEGHFAMLKVCSRCKQEKPVTEFYRRKSSKDGYDSWCKRCSAEGRDRENCLAKKRARYSQNAEASRQERREYYHRNKSRESNRAKRYYQSFKQKLVAYAAQYRENNRAWINQKRKAFYQLNRELESFWHRSWSKRNPEKTRINNNNRRARIRNAGGKFTAQEFRELCARYDWRCLACGEKRPLSPDHVVPISRGGSNDISNIQPLCSECNNRKHARTIDYRPRAGDP